jgi:hypothetical protein
MLKYIVSTLLCLSAGVSCMSREVPQEIHLPFGISAAPAVVYPVTGYLHLMLHDFEMALEDFRKATYCAEQCDAETAEEVECMVLFGQVIAYDNLNLRDDCDRALLALLTMHVEEDDFDVDDEEEDSEEDKQFNEEMHTMIYDLAQLCPSDDVRNTLTSLIEKEWNE